MTDQPMDNERIRLILLNSARLAAGSGAHERAALLEITAEYLTNPDFAKRLRDYVRET